MKKVLLFAFIFLLGLLQAQVKSKGNAKTKAKTEKEWVNPVKLTDEERSRPYMDEVLKTRDSLTPSEAERRRKNIAIGNPFEKYGVYPKIATLSKGKYLEFHDKDSIVSIGSVRFHRKQKKIVDFIEEDLSNPDRQPLGDTHGRWISPDPLSEEYRDWTPYRYGLNNPVVYTDPTGMLEDWYQDETTGDYEYWDGSNEIEGKKHLGASSTINVNNSSGDQIATVNLNSDGTADFVQGGETTSIGNTTVDPGFASGNRIRAGDWGLSANMWLGGGSSLIGGSAIGASAVGAIPFPKLWLNNTPSWFHGGLGRGWVKGLTDKTSIASFASRRIGLGGDFGRALPGNLLRGGLYQFGAQALHDGMLINSDAGVLGRQDALLNSSPLGGFNPEGFHLMRTDNKQNLIQSEKMQRIKDSLKRINPALYNMGTSGF